MAGEKLSHIGDSASDPPFSGHRILLSLTIWNRLYLKIKLINLIPYIASSLDPSLTLIKNIVIWIV